ncbi:MAG: hypothetical protein H7Y20_00570 [Bryobacteraceae bacterium]|nr:hypothetical protein [Bryobacteraceae bacterium]
MTTTDTQSKQQLYQLIDQLSSVQGDTLLAFAQFLRMDPVSRSILLAPLDDEPVTQEEQDRVQRAIEDPRPNVPFDQVKELFGR